MRLFKFIASGLIVLIIGLFVYQNIAEFTKPITFSFNLYIHEVLTGSISLYSLLLTAGIVGLLFGVFIMLKPYFNVRRQLIHEKANKQPIGTTGESASSSSQGTKETPTS